MNKKSIYHERLLEFADYLDRMDDKMISEEPENIIFHHLGQDGKGEQEVQYFGWIFADMPFISEEWVYNDYDQPVLLDNFDSTVNSIFSYFGIESPEVFRNLFSPYCQIEKHNGLLLSNKPLPSDVAKNICRYVESQAKN